MIEKLFQELFEIKDVDAIALGGSRAGVNFDKKSDYDVYVYVNGIIEENLRKQILSKYCSYTEIGNSFWEYEDNCVLNDGTDIDVLYRNADDFFREIENVVVKCIPSNSYTTCMWHNLLTCKIIYDKSGKLASAKKLYDVPYPPRLKEAIVNRQLKLIDESLPAYNKQITKALLRNDTVSVNHRITEFLASYFDLIFAINEKTHP